MKLFIVPSWYPSENKPRSGAFFADRAAILSRRFDVTVVVGLVYSFAYLFRISSWKKTKLGVYLESGMKTYRHEVYKWYPKFRRLAFRSYKKRMIKLITLAMEKEGKPDLVFIFSSLWAGAALGEFLHQNEIPYIVSEHLKEFLLPGGMNSYYKKKVTKSYQYAAKIIATSSALRDAIERPFPVARGKTAIIPNPANISAFQLAPKPYQAGDLFQMFCIAHLRPEKRLDILLRSFADALKTRTELRLTIAGAGNLRDDLLTLASHLLIREKVIFAGHLSKTEINEHLAASHALILTSEVETFGVALIEAMACGKPVIATRCGGPADIVTPETGLLADVNSVSSISGAINNLVENYHQYRPEIIRRSAEERFGDEAFISRVETILR